ncbi:hypothetical protein ZE65_13135 [Salmonella enterica subsp. diarizonae]|nr:hypothetical protein [Salmonella enterica subsp. diarizonae]
MVLLYLETRQVRYNNIVPRIIKMFHAGLIMSRTVRTVVDINKKLLLLRILNIFLNGGWSLFFCSDFLFASLHKKVILFFSNDNDS